MLWLDRSAALLPFPAALAPQFPLPPTARFFHCDQFISNVLEELLDSLSFFGASIVKDCPQLAGILVGFLIGDDILSLQVYFIANYD